MRMKTHDIRRDVPSPEALVAILRDAADEYRADAENLRGSWQDPNAGAIWDFAASQLDSVAERIENRWKRMA